MSEVYQGPCESLSQADLDRLGSVRSLGAGAFDPQGSGLSFSMKDVQPFVGQFISAADFLRFRVFTTLTEVTVHFRGRYLVCVGGRPQMVPFAQTVVATAAGGVAAIQDNQNDGFVAQLAASVDDDTIQSGDVYVIVEAGSVEEGEFFACQTHLAGYVTTRFPIVSSPSAPPNPPPTVGQQLVSVTSPAAGQEWSTIVPAGQIWRPISVHVGYTTNGSAGNREVCFRIGNGTSSGFGDDTGIYLGLIGGFNHGASRTVFYSWIRGATQYDGVQSPYAVLPLGDLYLKPGDKFDGHTTNKNAADQYSNIRILTEVAAI